MSNSNELAKVAQFVTVNTSSNVISSNATFSVNNFVMSGAFSANSSNGSLGYVLTSNGSSAYWSNITAVRQQFTGDGSTTVFTVTGGYTPNNLDVYLNGVKLRNGTDVTVTNGSTFTFTTAPPNGDLIDVIGSYASANGVISDYSPTFLLMGA